MSNSTTNRIALRSRLRSRAAAVTVGVCAAAVLGTTGAATAAGMAADGAGSDAFASHTAGRLAESTRGQAESQQDAAHAAHAAQTTKQEAEAAKRQLARSWKPPISADYTLTATFGNSGDRWATTHSGQDFAVPTGTTVRAVHGGTVVKAGGWGAGDGPAYGNAIVIKHSNGTYSQYAHLSRVEVSVGDKVTTGDRIARSGNTGNTTGPHLHFEIRTTPDYGTAIDPVQFLRGKHVTV
jgi:murein DD-endopeptidase MepM/ murein hydrolase activator NlpD